MGVRTNTDLAFQIGRDNALSNLAFDGALQQVLDSLEHASVGTITLAASESNFVVPFGDVAVARLVYIEGSRAFSATPGGLLATAAQVDGVGGSYPTGFAGGETLTLEIDNVAIAVTFDAADQQLDDVINRINAAAALAGLSDGTNPALPARPNGGGQLRLLSPTTGVSSEVDIQAATASVLSALGISVGVTNGAEAVPGQSPLQLLVPSTSDGVKSFAFMTLQTSGLTLTNLDGVNANEITYAVAGDLVTTPPGC